MMEGEDFVLAVVAAAGNELTGRVRLQKTVYFLERLGLGSGFEFDYHHYGPYSRALDNAVADAKAFDMIEEAKGQRKSDGAGYSIFKAKAAPKEEAFGRLGKSEAAKLVTLFAKTNVTVLELAATADWLWRIEKHVDWRGEITKRKGLKVQGGRLEKAVELLSDLGLPPKQI